MDRAMQTLRTLAGITLVVCVATVLYQLPTLSSTFSSYIAFNSGFNEFAWVTCGMLGFATGIVALVLAAQRRQWRWFVPLLVPAVLTPYGSLLVAFMFPWLFPRFVTDSETFLTLERFLVFSYTILPFVTALAVLIYTARSRRQQPIAPVFTEETDLEIEYTRLR
ncbi:MAG: hypothetical protein ACRDHP_10955 [Ktedonobacterales bacterium]